jgi:hypothetical protein
MWTGQLFSMNRLTETQTPDWGGQSGAYREDQEVLVG